MMSKLQTRFNGPRCCIGYLPPRHITQEKKQAFARADVHFSPNGQEEHGSDGETIDPLHGRHFEMSKRGKHMGDLLH